MKKPYKLLVLMMVMAIGFTGCANNSNKTNSNEKTIWKWMPTNYPEDKNKDSVSPECSQQIQKY